MRRIFLILPLVFISTLLTAQDFQQSVRQRVLSGELSRNQALLLQARRVLAPSQIPADMQNLIRMPEKSATGLSYEIKRREHTFSTDEQVLLRPFLTRPSTQKSYVSSDGRFRIHYDISGSAAVDLSDGDASGVPDYVEEVALAFEKAYQKEVVELGMNPPPSDNGVDGDEWDIYLEAIPGAYGWTNFDQKVDPAGDTWITYIEMDHNYNNTPTSGLDGARVTAAHEFFHMIQLGYSGRDDDGNQMLDDLFLLEASATWMEDVVYNDINDYINYLSTFFRQEGLPFDYPYGIHMYGLCLWFHFLEKRTGGPEYIRDLWNTIVTFPALQALDVSLRQLGSSFAEEHGLFRTWNYMTGDRSDSTMYYPEGALYPQLTISRQFTLPRDTSLSVQIQATASAYLTFSLPDDTSYTFVIASGDWYKEYQNGEVTLTLARGPLHEQFSAIGKNIQARAQSEEFTVMGARVLGENTGETGIQVASLLVDPYSGHPDDLPALYPNPFLPSRDFYTSLALRLGNEDEKKEVSVYTASGFLVRKETVEAGSLIYRWNGNDEHERPLSSGVYLFVVGQGDKILQKEKVLLIR